MEYGVDFEDVHYAIAVLSEGRISIEPLRADARVLLDNITGISGKDGARRAGALDEKIVRSLILGPASSRTRDRRELRRCDAD